MRKYLAQANSTSEVGFTRLSPVLSRELVMRIVSSLPEVGRRYSPVSRKSRGTEWIGLPKAAFGRSVALLREWRQRSRERAQLAALDERMLRDIGISRGDVLREINKPFWRA
jgi:uncharacterized protein YjiS (DUF1127 family)